MGSSHLVSLVVDRDRVAALDDPGGLGEGSASWPVQRDLDRIEQELSAELPSHMRAFARAHASGRTPPAAPLIARLASTLETALAACRQAELLRRGLAVLRVVGPIAIEDEPSVAAARRLAPSWEGLVHLAQARDGAARARFGVGAIELLHALHGTREPFATTNANTAVGEVVDGWQVPGPALDANDAQHAWDVVAAQLGLRGAVRIEAAVGARPRTFVVKPGREAIVVASAKLDTPAARFELLHELGHAAAALALDAGVPRVIDEGAAAYVARLMEPPSWLSSRWTSDLAAPARHRRTAIAVALDDIERALPDLPHVTGAAPPLALWHDPGAQASYVMAEAIADRLQRELGPTPARGAFARVLRAERDQIDHSSDASLQRLSVRASQAWAEQPPT